jgi:hypothetical protein
MNRKAKIKLLNDLMKGRKKLSDVDPYQSITIQDIIIGKGGIVLEVQEETILVEKKLFEK